MLKIVFMGTPDFARDSLKALVENGHKILSVVNKKGEERNFLNLL